MEKTQKRKHFIYTQNLTDRKIKAHKKKKAETQPEEVTQNEKRPRVPQQKNYCIFCQHDKPETLHSVTTLHFGQRLIEIALELEDTILLSRLGNGDLVALDGKWHPSCKISSFSKYRSFYRNKADLPLLRSICTHWLVLTVISQKVLPLDINDINDMLMLFFYKKILKTQILFRSKLKIMEKDQDHQKSV